MSDLIEIGERVRASRRERGLSQEALARLADTSRARIDAIENGRAAEVGFKLLLRILNALGLDLRLTGLNASRPTLEDLENEEGDHAAPGLGR